jgi:branched-chain amino acid transport system permease protein
MEIFLAQWINGIALGSVYALLVIGFNLMSIVAGVTHFAYPHVVVLSMYVIWYVLGATGGNAPIAILAGIGSGVAISLATEPIFRPLTARRAWIASFIATLGLSMIITDAMAHGMHAGRVIPFPASFVGTIPVYQLGVATLFRGQLMTFIGCISVMVGFFYLLYRTQIGRAFRSMAENPFVARLRGIPIARTSRNSYAIAGLLGGMSSVFLSMALRYASPALGNFLALKVVTIALLAGLGNLRGGLIAALIIGMVESMVTGYVPGEWSGAVVFGAMLIAILARPAGVFSQEAQSSG